MTPTDSPYPQLSIRSYRDRNRVVVRLEGELDMQSTPDVARAVDDALRDAKEVVVDLSALAFMDSSGLAVLVRASIAAELDGWTLCLRRPTAQVRRAFELSGLLDGFAIED